MCGSIFSKCNPAVVGTGGLVLFPGTPLIEEVKQADSHRCQKVRCWGELKLFAEHLNCDCSFITHHTISGRNLSGPDFMGRKEKIIAALDQQSSDTDIEAAL